MLARLKTCGLVTLIAALIWLWAEAESLKAGSATTRVVFVRTPDTAVRVTDSPSRETVTARVRLEGSTSAIDEAQRLLASQVELTPGVGGVPGAPGGTTNLLEALRESRELARTGVTIISVEPATVTLMVVKLVARDLPVQADLTGIDAEGEATVSPATVRVTMPEEEARKLPESTPAVAVIAPEDLGPGRDEGPRTVIAKVRLPSVLTQGAAAEFVTMPRDTVRVTLRVRKRVDSLELATVPVWITLPPTEGTAWDVEVVEPFLRGVTVMGPKDLVQRIRQHELVAIAFVVLSSDELAAGIKSKPAVFAPVAADLIGAGAGGERGAPAGVGEAALMEQVAPLKFSAENRRVELKIRRRGSVGGGAGPAGGW